MASEASYREGSSQTPALKAFEKSHGKPGIPLFLVIGWGRTRIDGDVTTYFAFGSSPLLLVAYGLLGSLYWLTALLQRLREIIDLAQGPVP
jgi:hypothetical protein